MDVTWGMGWGEQGSGWKVGSGVLQLQTRLSGKEGKLVPSIASIVTASGF